MSSAESTRPPPPPQHPMTCVVVNCRVQYLRPAGYKDLAAWVDDAERNVYIGRAGIVFIQGRRFPPQASPWANPYKVTSAMTRDEALRRYRSHLGNNMSRGRITWNQVGALRGKCLGCWCVPDACHGHVLVELVKMMDEDGCVGKGSDELLSVAIERGILSI